MYKCMGMNTGLFTTDDLETIHVATVRVLEYAGVKIFGDEALEVFSGAGCDVDAKNKKVKIPQHVVEDAIARSPSKVLLAGRDPKHDVVLEGHDRYFINFGVGILVDDPLTGELRDTTKQDLADSALVCHALDEVDIFTLAVVARDAPDKSRRLHEEEAAFNNTTKYFHHDGASGVCTKQLIEMGAAIVGGVDKLVEPSG